MGPAEVRYARSGTARIAYQVVGQGALDLVLAQGFVSNLDILREEPAYGRLIKRLSTFGRLILFDQRGTGLSDGLDGGPLPDLAARSEDIVAVMDAAGCGRAAIIGASDGAARAILLAATRPERVRALVLCGGYAHFHGTAMDAKRLRSALETIDSSWGSGATLSWFAPSRTADRRLAEWWGRFERLSASPSAAIALLRMNAAIDVRDHLAAVRAPTLVIHAAHDAHAGIDGGRQIARTIAGARLVELPGRDHPMWLGDVDRIADQMEEFLTGERPVPGRNSALAVLLVARLDIAPGRDTSGRQAALLDERLERFREAVPKVLERIGGQAEWLGPDRIVGRFESPARAAGAALALRESAGSLGLPIAQGIHVGEIDPSQRPLFGLPIDIAVSIASAARPAEILLSRLASALVSGAGLQFVDRQDLSVEGIRDPMPIVALEAERHLEPARAQPRAANPAVLSDREREVLALVAEGLSNSHIAVQLGLSEHTVKRHVANILLKLDLPTRAAAAAMMAGHRAP